MTVSNSIFTLCTGAEINLLLVDEKGLSSGCLKNQF
jgi:hypothetical protein